MSLNSYSSSSSQKNGSAQPKKKQKKIPVSRQPPKTLLETVKARVSAAVEPLIELSTLLEKNKNDVTAKLIAMTSANTKARPGAPKQDLAEYTVWSFFEEHMKQTHGETDKAFYRREKAEREAVSAFLKDYLFDLDRQGTVTRWVIRNNLTGLDMLETIGGSLTDAGQQSDADGKQEAEWSDALYVSFGRTILSCIRATEETKKVIGQLFTAATDCDDEKYVDRYSMKLYKILCNEEMFESEKDKAKRLAKQNDTSNGKESSGKRKSRDDDDDDEDEDEDDEDDDEDDEDDDEDDEDDDGSSEGGSGSDSIKSEKNTAVVLENPFKKVEPEPPKQVVDVMNVDQSPSTEQEVKLVEDVTSTPIEKLDASSFVMSSMTNKIVTTSTATEGDKIEQVPSTEQAAEPKQE